MVKSILQVFQANNTFPCLRVFILYSRQNVIPNNHFANLNYFFVFKLSKLSNSQMQVWLKIALKIEFTNSLILSFITS